MPTYLCPKGHDSVESDYCSECGTKIQGAAIPLVTPIRTASEVSSEETSNIPAPPEAVPCPDCATPHLLHEGNFCEICGYNFTTGAHGELPVEKAEKPVTSQPVSQPVFQPTSKASDQTIVLPNSATGWSIVISVDPTRSVPDRPPVPTQAPITLPLDKAINLMGRTSAMRAVYPEVALDFDQAVSQRHALLTIQPDGSLIFRDIGSSNGTQINGVEATVMADILLHDQDELTLGYWTKVQVYKQSGK